MSSFEHASDGQKMPKVRASFALRDVKESEEASLRLRTNVTVL